MDYNELVTAMVRLLVFSCGSVASAWIGVHFICRSAELSLLAKDQTTSKAVRDNAKLTRWFLRVSIVVALVMSVTFAFFAIVYLGADVYRIVTQ